MRLDPSKLDLKNPRVHRTDRDFAVAWAKMYGKGRVFYTTLGHVEANWDKAEMQAMMTERDQVGAGARGRRRHAQTGAVQVGAADASMTRRQFACAMASIGRWRVAGAGRTSNAQTGHRHVHVSQPVDRRHDRPADTVEDRRDRNVSQRVHVVEPSDTRASSRPSRRSSIVQASAVSRTTRQQSRTDRSRERNPVRRAAGSDERHR